MIKDILTAAGVLHRQSRFIRTPKETHAVYFDNIRVDSADPVLPFTAAGLPRVLAHEVRVELYEYSPDDAKEAAIEAEFNARGIPWTKEDRYWLETEQWYQVIYEISYYEKVRT